MPSLKQRLLPAILQKGTLLSHCKKEPDITLFYFLVISRVEVKINYCHLFGKKNLIFFTYKIFFLLLSKRFESPASRKWRFVSRILQAQDTPVEAQKSKWTDLCGRSSVDLLYLFIVKLKQSSLLNQVSFAHFEFQNLR